MQISRDIDYTLKRKEISSMHMLPAKWTSFFRISSWLIINFITTYFISKKLSIDDQFAFNFSATQATITLPLLFALEFIFKKLSLQKKKLTPSVIWLTGRPCSGKTTIAKEVTQKLAHLGYAVEHLDGDSVRNYFPETAFTEEARNAHIRRMGFLAKKLSEQGVFVVASFVSPYQEGREEVRKLCSRFFEIYVSTPLETCEKRDVKGHYAKARRNELENFTGISAPYQIPTHPELILNTDEIEIEACVKRILTLIQ